jgi:hypothetical protein
VTDLIFSADRIKLLTDDKAAEHSATIGKGDMKQILSYEHGANLVGVGAGSAAPSAA